MSTYATSDPCTDIILDFIAGPESGGNYNAYFGHANSTVSLEWPLDKVYAFQVQLAANNGVSSATGRYQFLTKTLKALAARLELPGSTIFTPVLQDRLAVELLIDCKYKSWYRGELPNDELAAEMSVIWASLPDPLLGGASHWPGQRAGVTLPAVYAMLTQARAAQQVPATMPPPAAPQAPAMQARRYKLSQDLLALANEANALSV